LPRPQALPPPPPPATDVIPLALSMHCLLLGWFAVVVVPGLTGLGLLIAVVWALYALRMGSRAP
jgi:hypothetical protein